MFLRQLSSEIVQRQYAQEFIKAFDELEDLLPDNEFPIFVITVLNGFQSDIILDNVISINSNDILVTNFGEMHDMKINIGQYLLACLHGFMLYLDLFLQTLKTKIFSGSKN